MTGFSTFLGFPLLFWQTSFGTSTHSSTGVSLGTSLVTWEPKQDNEYEDNEVSLIKYLLFTFSLWREVTLLLRQLLDHGLDLVVALLRPGHKPAARGPTQALRNLLALGHRVCLKQRHGINTDMVHDINTVYLGPELLGDGAHLPRPLAALLVRHVAAL